MSQDGGGQRETRRLAAILIADVVGYSRLMAADEEGTLALLRGVRTGLIAPTIEHANGRLVKSVGDGFLVEFASVVDALRAALAWQRGMAERNAGQPADRQLVFRIGINLGDVIVDDDDDLYGDGVNIADRLQGQAPPAGICLSGAAYDQVNGKVAAHFASVGELRVKNIDRPVRAYFVAPESGAVPPLPARRRLRPAVAVAVAGLLVVAAALGLWRYLAFRMPAELPAATLAVPENPSIAVLPFENIGAPGNDADIGSGLTEDLIASLSKVQQIFVIDRNSVLTYRGRPTKAQDVGRDLGVRYVLTGSVQRSGDRLRIAVQLTDAATGYQLWGDTFDRRLNDVFALQDEISLNVITALQIKLTQGEQARIRQRGTRNLKAWLLVSQSLNELMGFTRESNARARQLAEQALAIDPDYAEAYVRLARTYLLEYQTGWARDREATLARTVELAQTALKLDDSYPDTYILLASIYLCLRDHEAALLSIDKALSLSPSHALAKANLGMIRTYAGDPEGGASALRDAMRLSPRSPGWFLSELARADFQLGRYVEAAELLRRQLRAEPDDGQALILLAATEAAAGHQQQAEMALARFLVPRPAYTLDDYAQGEFYKRAEDLQRVLDALRKAGLPPA